MKDYSKIQAIISAVILVVLIGILIAFVYVANMLSDTLKSLEPAINEATATLENSHSITDRLNEIMPQIENALISGVKENSTKVLEKFKSLVSCKVN